MSRNSRQKHPLDDSLDEIAASLNAGLEQFSRFLFIVVQKIFQRICERIEERKFGTYRNSPIELKSLNVKKVSQQESELGFSVSRKRPLTFSEIDFKRHTAVIGSTGSGKSVCLENLMTNSLMTGKPIIYFDPKPSLEGVKRFQGLCRKFGKTAYVVSDVLHSCQSFNPLIEGSAHDITNRIMAALEWSESFYKNEAQRVLYEAVLQCQRDQSPITMENLTEKLGSYHDRKTISGLLSQMVSIAGSEYSGILNATDRNSLTFRSIRSEGACVYIGISSLGMGSVGMAVNKLYFGGLLYHSKEALNGLVPKVPDPLEKPISIFFDELASIAHSGFIDLQNKCRAAGIEITYATQCPSDLDRISQQMTLQIFENTNNFFIFNQLIPTHTEFFSKLAGTQRMIKRTYTTEDGLRGNRGSEREVESFVAHANIFRSLKVGQCVFIQRSPRRVDLLNTKFIKSEPEVLERRMPSAYAVRFGDEKWRR